ncbi:MAG: endonuclease III [Bacteroidales bacterium]|nr:endonuclease III [Bacteroidales bacterium]
MSSLSTKYQFIIEYFQKNNPNAKSELLYNNSFELLVAVVLSAQCTDKRVNMVTPTLFTQYPTAKTMASASVDEIFQLIKSISYPNNKAKHLHDLAEKLTTNFCGTVPQTREELMTLSGVGRKSANVILSVCYHQPAMAVDTHVFRVSHRLGIVSTGAKTPERVEQELVSNFPDELIAVAHHWLILHGRYVCTAIKPQCQTCGLNDICEKRNLKN